MKVGIIGAGKIDRTRTRRLTQLGHEVRVANSRDPQTLAELASETGATAVWASEAAEDADLVIASRPSSTASSEEPPQQGCPGRHRGPHRSSDRAPG